MLAISGLCKSYGALRVLDGVDLTVQPGQILGLVGSNGAGKTTVISIAAGLRTADAGTVLMGPGREATVDVLSHPRRAARLLGLAPQELGVYPMLTIEQNLMTFGQLAGFAAPRARVRAREIAETLGLEKDLAKPASTLSGGQARRLHTGMALMHHPPVLFLDEPTVGADVPARRSILGAVRSLAAEGAAIVYTTHYLSELSDLAADVAILDRGRIAFLDTVAGLLARYARPSVGVVTAGVRPDLPGWSAVAHGADVGDVRWEPDPHLLATCSATELVAGALKRLGGDTRLVGIDISPPSIESAFLEITGRALTVDDAHGNEEATDACVA